jgi:hypothetical protein
MSILIKINNKPITAIVNVIEYNPTRAITVPVIRHPNTIITACFFSILSIIEESALQMG